MSDKKPQRFIFWIILMLIVIVFFEAMGYLAMKFNSRGQDFLSNRTYFHIRDMLMDNQDTETYPKYLSQPYLAYVPYPGYSKQGRQEHNMAGYRGKEVPLAHDDKYRILCMGGSTTYGFKLIRFEQTYPAQLDSLLNANFDTNPAFLKKYKGIEVINAGLEAGSSAEELAQYVFKYHYYKPDLIILNSGGNDALISPIDTNYQPDYTHYRRMDFNLRPLPKQSAWLMRSYFFSYFFIRLFYNSYASPFYYFEQDGSNKFCHWNTMNEDSLIKKSNYDYCAFPHNFKSLINEIKMDSAHILLIPFVLNPYNKMVKENEEYRNSVALYNLMMKDAAVANNCAFLNFTADSIDYGRYGMDDCHLNAEGERLKAQMIYRKVAQLIEGQISN